MSEYKLVVRFAPYGTGYLKTDGSISKSIGHVWYEVYKDNEKKPMVSKRRVGTRCPRGSII